MALLLADKERSAALVAMLDRFAAAPSGGLDQMRVCERERERARERVCVCV